MISGNATTKRDKLHYIAWIYIAFHISAYFLLQLRDVDYNYIHSSLDDKIPFIEYFIVPYVFWFVYMAGGIILFLHTSKKDFIRMSMFTFVGLFICMSIAFIYPTAINFRPSSFERDNIFIRLTLLIYSSDQPVNVWPSMHCFGSLGICFAFLHTDFFKRNAVSNVLIKIGSTIIALAICAATVFIKQHSILDVFAALALCMFLYPIAYIIKWPFLIENINQNNG